MIFCINFFIFLFNVKFNLILRMKNKIVRNWRIFVSGRVRRGKKRSDGNRSII